MSLHKEDVEKVENGSSSHIEIDLATYHEVHAGRLVIDPECVAEGWKFLIDFL